MSGAGLIHSIIPKIMEEIGFIGKEKKNQQQGYNFRGIDDVYNAAQPAMIRHKVFPTTEVHDLHREDRQSKNGGGLIYTTLLLKVTFWAEDGSSVTTTTAGEGMDSGDKSANKAMSTALKYAFFQTFVIPTQEMLDSERETHEIAPPQPKTVKKKAADEKPQMSPEQAAFNEWVKPHIGKEFTKDQVVAFLKSVNNDYKAAQAEMEKILASEGAAK